MCDLSDKGAALRGVDVERAPVLLPVCGRSLISLFQVALYLPS